MILLFIPSVFIGFYATSIPWGNPTGFHGKGLPFAQVYWDKNVDFPNPYAHVLNMASFLLLGILLILLFFCVLKLVRRFYEGMMKRGMS